MINHYDKRLKEQSTGIGTASGTGMYLLDVDFSKNVSLEAWERSYILCCGWCECSFIPENTDEIEYGLYRGIIRLLQELYMDGDMDTYFELNRQIEYTCQKYHFTGLDLQGKTSETESLYYMHWLTERYERSLNQKDYQSSQELYELLKEALKARMNKLKMDIQCLADDICVSENYDNMSRNVRCLFSMAKIVPDSIVQLEQLKKYYIVEMHQVKKKLMNNQSVCAWIEKQLHYMEFNE